MAVCQLSSVYVHQLGWRLHGGVASSCNCLLPYQPCIECQRFVKDTHVGLLHRAQSYVFYANKYTALIRKPCSDIQ